MPAFAPKRRIAIEPFLTPAEVAAALRVHRRTITRMIARGAIQALRVGSDWRIKQSEVERFIRFGGRAA